MKTYFKLMSALFLIFSITTTVSFGKGYTISGHSITVTKVDSTSTSAIIQLINHDSTSILQVKWRILSDNFAFTGWSYTVCDFGLCYTGTYPQSATDPLAPHTDGAFNITVDHFNNIASSATMVVKVWDPTDPNNSDTISMTINATRLGISNAVLPSSSFSLFPNPAKNYITLGMNQQDFVPAKAVVYNLLGSTISVLNFSNGTTNLPVYDLPKGLYIMSVKDQNGREAIKEFSKE